MKLFVDYHVILQLLVGFVGADAWCGEPVAAGKNAFLELPGKATSCPIINGLFSRKVKTSQGRELEFILGIWTKVENGITAYRLGSASEQRFLPADGEAHKTNIEGEVGIAFLECEGKGLFVMEKVIGDPDSWGVFRYQLLNDTQIEYSGFGPNLGATFGVYTKISD